jgi:hypothetical protein
MRLGHLALHGALVVIVVGLHFACGGSGGSGAASPSSASTEAKEKSDKLDKGDRDKDKGGEVANGTTLTEFQKKRLLGHYSTQDGGSGFILDRTVTPWRGKLDGTSKVVTLQETNTPRRGMKEYQSDDKSIWVRVDTESGRVELFQGPKQHEGVRVVRDADADQLK